MIQGMSCSSTSVSLPQGPSVDAKHIPSTNSAELCLSWSDCSGKGATLTVIPGNGTPTVPGRLSPVPELKCKALHYSNTKAVAMPLECVDNVKPEDAAFDTAADDLITWAACAWQST